MGWAESLDRTGLVYHHACSQTALPPKAVVREPKAERDVQTVLVKSGGQQASRHCATQMERPDLVLDFSQDRCLMPGKPARPRPVLPNIDDDNDTHDDSNDNCNALGDGL